MFILSRNDLDVGGKIITAMFVIDKFIMIFKSKKKVTMNLYSFDCNLRYELDFNKPKTWSWFETFYDETAHLQEEPRSGR